MYISQEEFDAAIKQFAEEQARKKKESIELLASDKAKGQIKLMQDFLAANPDAAIVDDVYRKEDLIPGLNNEDFVKLHDAVMDNSDVTWLDSTIDYSNDNVVYENLRFTVIMGQGSILSVSLPNG